MSGSRVVKVSENFRKVYRIYLYNSLATMNRWDDSKNLSKLAVIKYSIVSTFTAVVFYLACAG